MVLYTVTQWHSQAIIAHHLHTICHMIILHITLVTVGLGRYCKLSSISHLLATETTTHWFCEAGSLYCLNWKRPWFLERLRAGGEEDARGWDGWMTSPTWGTRVWASSGSWWWTGKPGMLQSMGSQRVGATELTELKDPGNRSPGFPQYCSRTTVSVYQAQYQSYSNILRQMFQSG